MLHADFYRLFSLIDNPAGFNVSLPSHRFQYLKWPICMKLISTWNIPYGINFSKNFAKSTMHMFQLVFLHVHARTNKWNLIKNVYINLKVSQMLHRGNLRAHVEWIITVTLLPLVRKIRNKYLRGYTQIRSHLRRSSRSNK